MTILCLVAVSSSCGEAPGGNQFTAFETLDYHEDTQRLSVTASPPGVPRHTVTLSVTGSPAFCRAFQQRFD